MPSFCCVLKCGMRGERDQVSFFRLPAVLKTRGDLLNSLSAGRQKAWINALKRGPPNESQLKYWRVCSRHFIEGKPSALEESLHPDWVPSQNMGYVSSIQPKECSASRYQRSDRRKRQKVVTEAQLTEEITEEIFAPNDADNVQMEIVAAEVKEPISAIHLHEKFLSTMAPKLKLIYFDAPARAESARLILNAGGVPFEDHRIAREEWPKLKPTTPWGQLPILEVDGEKIAQSVAISRYCAKLAKINGKNELEDLKIDEVVDTISDVLKKETELLFEKDEAKKKTTEETLLKETLPFFLKKLDEKAKANKGHLAVPRLSWADIMFVVFYEGSMNIFKKDVFADYPNLLQVKKNVLSVPGVKEYIKKRPENKGPFGGFYDLKNDV